MHFDKAAVEHALDHVAKIADSERFATLTRGVSMLEPDVAARAVLVMLLPELAGADAYALGELPLSEVTLQPAGDRLTGLTPEDVAEHPLAAILKPTLGATLGRRLRFGAGREDLLPHDIQPQVLEIIRGAPGEVWASLTFAYPKSGAHGAAIFGRRGAVHPVLRHTAIAAVTLTELGGVAYALTLARAEPEPDAIAVPPAVAPEAVSPETLH